MDINEIAAKMQERVAASGFDRSVKFDFGDEKLLIDGQTVSTEDGAADCTIAMSKDDFEAMVSGDLNPTAAFMQGKLKVDGDMSVAMQLSQLL
ncbi:sterol-binding protein [Chelativorans sp. ZYF759]|uniref:SCP2 sterol-binding domain-containing protein n=1 Tax=Chelativorans sp. ZYF759 TaxID=2692213 RepID=UPI00145DB921|nr:SCP2 sterol-binding domain-containing protein [Chelativorans sp. ZYF759]NMG40304.1 sterol-binding protein [Chelativorans sp. ZYF759]